MERKIGGKMKKIWVIGILVLLMPFVAALTLTRISPLYLFTVEITGVEVGQFSTVSGLEANIEVIEFQDGNDLFLRKRPGRTTFSNILMTTEGFNSKSFDTWWRNSRDGIYDRKDMSIIMRDSRGNEIRSWNVYGCWPKRRGFVKLVYGDDQPFREFIEFVAEDIEIN